jgi:hypothetical protein
MHYDAAQWVSLERTLLEVHYNVESMWKLLGQIRIGTDTTEVLDQEILDDVVPDHPEEKIYTPSRTLNQVQLSHLPPLSFSYFYPSSPLHFESKFTIFQFSRIVRQYACFR